MIKYVSDYIKAYKSGKIKFNKERIELVDYIDREIKPRLKSKEIYFNKKQIEACINFIEAFFFPLEDFQKFIICFVFLYFTDTDINVYKKFLAMMARGAGKNGFLSGLSAYMLSSEYGTKNYDISIVANSEDQAKTSFSEIYNVIKNNPVLESFYYRTKTEITNLQTNSVIKYRTSNGNTKDGLRDGAVIFDEIHQYESNKDVRVHISGLGKVDNPREFYIGTDGYLRDGFIDKMKDKADKVLKGDARFNALFPFICKLDNVEQVDNPKNWEMANPMFCEPMSRYARNLFETVKEQYEDLADDPSNREEFMTKRMNLPVTDLERSVASFEELKATKREFPDLKGRMCIGGLDYAALRDFAAVGLLFKDGEDYVWLSHSFVRKEFVDSFFAYSRTKDFTQRKKVLAPIREWEQRGLLTVLDEPSIDPQHIVDWFVNQRDANGYDLQTIVADNFRIEILRPLFEAAGFEVSFKKRFDAPVGYQVEVLRNPRAIDSLLAPRIEDAFANKHVNFGDNDMMRWYTNNVLRRLKPDGNVEYIKKEQTRRKTDGFKAFEYALYNANQLETESTGEFLDSIMEWY